MEVPKSGWRYRDRRCILAKKGFLLWLTVSGFCILGYGISFDVTLNLDYQLASFPGLKNSLIDPLNQALSALNATLPPGTGTLQPLPEMSGAWSQILEGCLWFNRLWGVGAFFLHSAADTSAKSTLNIDLEGGSFKLDCTYRLRLSGMGGGVGPSFRLSFGPFTGRVELKLLYLLGRLEAKTVLQFYDFSAAGVEPPANLSITASTGYQTTGFGYEASFTIGYSVGHFTTGLSLGYRSVPFTFGDFDANGTRDDATLGGVILGGQITVRF